MKKLVWASIVMCVAFGAATAALRMAGAKDMLFAAGGKIPALDTDNLPPLIAGHALSVTRAFGDDNEDCITVTRAAMRPDRSTHLRRKIICAE
jgi:hypothetical protein